MPERVHSAQPPSLATIGFVAAGGRMSVTVRGELDIGAQWLQPELRDILGRSATGVDLDLSAVRFCDCGGLNVLLDLRHHALDQGKTVAVRACSPVVRRLLDLTGTGELFTHSGPDGLDAPPPAVLDGRSGQRGVDHELRTEVAQLRRAMRTRPAIDVARGILMASFSLSAEAAWTVLVTASQNTNTKLHHLAQDLMDTVHGTPLPEEVREQVAAAVAKVQAAPPIPLDGVPVPDVTPEPDGAPPRA
ncbi:ANTAR domain-containing protein [Streptomyces sp. NBC_00201]|uniref:ANTAR domain-containing protein n=1 Tax=unclassified Streptomyces TaxID=2593676 RepID=UPI00224D41D9|nr:MULTISPECIES: ANTAR domain-containing protein [unclassified Streptomyces]MCX5058833.1 ANTAR domain-containing protein [Streptomyces sp. NBC_00452]MCX5244287.1 ANTAR domain-containing protein [Streptomyces sp. NBC_00201]MCX5289981.1 ANTAR domain-containing protein [Streptomyces sp. NBC_00183]